MKILSDKLTERFKNMGLAFRYFDLHSVGKLNLADFSFGLDQLMVKFNRQ
jgi:hypothetical protein